MTVELKKILCADDDPLMRKLISYSLAKSGKYEILICESGADLLTQVEAFKPNLILLDIMMPGFDGKQTFEELCNSGYRDVPVVFLAGDQDDQRELLSLGAIGVIEKPFDPNSLSQAIENHWQAFLQPQKKAVNT